MSTKKDRVLRAELKPNCYVLISAQFKDDQPRYYAFPVVSFLYDDRGTAAEWCPPYGPIQIWHECLENDEGAKPHYFYAFENSPPGSWAQAAVEEYDLPGALVNGNFDCIFATLKNWAERH